MKTGDIIRLGPHRLMCGDAGDPEHVAALFQGRKPDLVFTSPPYDKQRDYKNKIDCWLTLMCRVFGAMPHHEKTQVLVNLGLIHRKGEWIPYWDEWIERMRNSGWRRFGLYVWDKNRALPGTFNGRPSPIFEFLFHFNRVAPRINKTIPCQSAGAMRKQSAACRRTGHGRVRNWHGTIATASHKIPSAIFQATPSGHALHPAVFPIALPAAIHAAYTDPGDLIYDPFVGSGTSILAAEQGKRVCYAMEIAPEYCDIVIQRWIKAVRAT